MADTPHSGDALPGAPLPEPHASCDGGDLDCGSGLLLIIRNEMKPLGAGHILEVKSREISVKEDLPAWCRMVGHALLGSEDAENRYTYYYIRKKGAADDAELDDDVAQAKDYVWRVRVRWKEGMQARAFVRNHGFDVGQPASFDTEDPAPSAIEYLLSSLAGCLAVGFQWRLSRRNIEVFNLEVSLNARVDNIMVFLDVEEEGHPGLAGVEGRVFVDADAEEEELTDVWRDTVKRSPITQTLLRQIPFSVEMRPA